jgi:hypothetical protein
VQGILKAAQAVSGVSTRQHIPGQQAAVLSKPSVVITTQRVSTTAFQGLVFTDASSIVTVDLPPDFFAQANLGGQEEVDVMLAVWNIATPPIPPPQGSSGSIKEDFLSPIVTLEVRKPGSTSEVEWRRALETPVLLSVINSRAVDGTKDYATGRALMAAPMLWDWAEWGWTIRDTRSVREAPGPAGLVVTASADVLEHLAIVTQMAGCDNLPKSPAVFDACRVCNGDNSTCSGCDGRPNTGAGRSCNGHGQCGVDRCSCHAFYFGFECETYCSEMSTCSGHGLCHPASGVPCTCDLGWQTQEANAATDGDTSAADAEADRGPYCSEPLYDPFAQVASDGKPPMWQLVLIILLPSLVVLACIMYTVREVQRENGFNDLANRMMIFVGMDKEEKREEESEPPVPDILPPSDPAHAEMLDMAPYHAKRCVELQPSEQRQILALSDQVIAPAAACLAWRSDLAPACLLLLVCRAACC